MAKMSPAEKTKRKKERDEEKARKLAAGEAHEEAHEDEDGDGEGEEASSEEEAAQEPTASEEATPTESTPTPDPTPEPEASKFASDPAPETPAEVISLDTMSESHKEASAKFTEAAAKPAKDPAVDVDPRESWDGADYIGATMKGIPPGSEYKGEKFPMGGNILTKTPTICFTNYKGGVLEVPASLAPEIEEWLAEIPQKLGAFRFDHKQQAFHVQSQHATYSRIFRIKQES